MKKTAILLGATGLTGSKLLQLLLQDDRFQKVVVLTRRSTHISHEKLEEHIIDLFSLEEYPVLFQAADVVFCCIGTTKAKTPDKELYYRIDHGIPVATARMTKKNNIPTFIVISAVGANSKSRFSYNRIKGEMERDVLELDIKNTYILQPSLISGDREEKRTGENLAEKLMQVFDFFIPSKLKIISADTIAKAMLHIAHHGYKSSIIPSDEIHVIENMTAP